MEEEDGAMELDFDFVPTVHVGVEGGSFSADVIELYELPFEKVMKALSVPNGPAQMMAMLEIFKLAVVDQTKLDVLDSLSFNELAEILGQWAVKSTPPGVDVEIAMEKRKRPRIRKINHSDEDINRMIEAVMNPETPLEELMEIADKVLELDGVTITENDLDSNEEPPRKRGRHAKPYDAELDGPLNDPGDDISPF